MKIITIIENTSLRSDICPEHGLSVYIETEKHKIISDTGASPLTWQNAKNIGLDVSKADTVIISHGHFDHAGGLMSLAKIAPQADVYMQKSALGNFCHGEKYIGIDPKIRELPKLHLINGDVKIDDEISLFSDIKGRRLWPQSNIGLTELVNGEYIQDSFRHEQVLVIRCEEKYLLISGCAHNGILNVLDRFREIYDRDPDIVISGFHMMKKSDYTDEEINNIKDTAYELTRMKTRFYTGHCTGQPAFDIMKEIMGSQLTQLHSGEAIL